MSDTMRLLPMEELISRIFEEYFLQGSVLDLPQERWFRKKDSRKIRVLGEECETPVGPAAGPHTQLAQNIVSAYLTGSRFIELKTVQILDALEIEKPCIDASDEAYNTEWSTELTLDEAWGEYAKGWILLHLLETVFDLKMTGMECSFIFNMSVGYDMKGITSEPMTRYIARMKDSSREPYFRDWLQAARASATLLDGTPLESKMEAVKNLDVSGKICTTVTLSTMHGCPPDEIEQICELMLTDKDLDTFVKLNPTLLGYEEVRGILDGLGYTYLTLSHDSFDHDLQYSQAVEILTRLRKLADERGKGFGVKLSNTLPSVNDQGRLPGDEMFMSGRALYPLAINLAAKLSREFDGDLPISYSGGITAYNVADVFNSGIRPITYATELLKPGGYTRQLQLLDELQEKSSWENDGVNVAAVETLAEAARSEKTVEKSFRGEEEVHNPGELPLFDCYVAPCVTACPIGQNVPEYIRLVSEGRHADALEVIYERNALPSITGHICDHQCQLVCTRLDYEGELNIREMKRIAVTEGMAEYRARLDGGTAAAGAVVSGAGATPAGGATPASTGASGTTATGVTSTSDASRAPRRGEKIAVIGAGPAGLSTAYFLAREGFGVTVLEREENAGGVVGNVVPHFRISREAIESDIAMIRDLGVEFVFGYDGSVDTAALKGHGYDFVALALGTYQPKPLRLEGKNRNVVAAYPFLMKFNKARESLSLGRRVVVVGAGDTAMDCARAALRSPGVEEVTVAYRRAEEQMPATEEEYELAVADGITFRWLRNPEQFDEGGRLTLRVMELGEPDGSGRRRPVPTDRSETIVADYVIHAIGDAPESGALEAAGLKPEQPGGLVKTGSNGETDVEKVFLVGDSRTGPSTIVQCIAEGRRAAEAIIRSVDPSWERVAAQPDLGNGSREEEIRHKKGCLHAPPAKVAGSNPEAFAQTEGSRCLECNYICNKCVDVCPNRANIAVPVGAGSAAAARGGVDSPGGDKYQIVHLDAYCNECGNCGHFCPWEGKPYKDKPTIFNTAEDFTVSTNQGWLLEDDLVRLRFGGEVRSLEVKEGRLLDGDGRYAAETAETVTERRFLHLFEELYSSRPTLFGPVMETRRKPAEV